MYSFPRSLLLVFEHCGQSADMRLNLDRELIAVAQKLLGVFAHTHTSRSSGKDDGASGQSGALRAEAHELGDAEDEVVDARILHDIAVLAAFDVKLAWVGDQL